MNKIFIIRMILFAAAAWPLLTGCNKADEPEPEPTVPSEYLYVLNCGSMGSKNAGLTLYDIKEGTIIKDVFEAQNGRRLGETGQDIIIYGSKMYISMTDEMTVEVTDLDAKSIKQIPTEGKPRYFAADAGKVYVTYWNGLVARIDTTLLVVEATTQVGRNPEQLVVANERLYVANSGGLDFNTEAYYDKTVSVVDIASFTETKKIEVEINPFDVVSDGYGNIYVVSVGNYMDIPNSLQIINTTTELVTLVTDVNATFITAAGSILYAISAQYDSDWNAIFTYSAYDMLGNSLLTNNFIGSTKIDNTPIRISSDMESGDVYITTSDYLNDGDVYIFNKSNQFVRKFEAGLNPMKVVYVKK